jgi:uncharacterized metal-binding protein YceD (DUF177 family)
VKALAKYDVEIQGLKLEKYVFEYESGSEFFEALEQDLIQSGHFKTILTLEKTSTMLILDFQIVGHVELICDRSLEDFKEPINIKERLIVKFGDHNEELSDEIVLLKHETPRLNVAQPIFDYMALSLPMKRLHPRFRTENDGDDDTEGVLVFSSGQEPEQDDQPNIEKPAADPRWEALKKLKN